MTQSVFQSICVLHKIFKSSFTGNECAAAASKGGGASDRKGSQKKGKAAKALYKVARVKRVSLPDGVESDSDSDIEREKVDAFWEGKHVPCVRLGIVLEKCTMTKKEAHRRVRESC